MSLTVSALQSILYRNDLAERLWPLNDSEDQSGSPPKWNHLENAPRLTIGKISCKSMHNVLREAAHGQTDRMTDRPIWSHNSALAEVTSDVAMANKRASTRRNTRILALTSPRFFAFPGRYAIGIAINNPNFTTLIVFKPIWTVFKLQEHERMRVVIRFIRNPRWSRWM